MIKKIPVSELKVGMFVSDMNKDWIPHNNLSKQGFIRKEAVIERIQKLGITDVYIDTERGLDTPHGMPAAEADQRNQAALENAGELTPSVKPDVALAQEMDVADRLHKEATGLVSNVLEDVKLGRAIDVGSVDELADGLLDSIFRNHNALACLGRIRNKDSYLLEHSVNLSVLMSVFGKAIMMDRNHMHQTVVGALLHDIGKILIPDDVLHKPGRLTDEEFAIMKNHVLLGKGILEQSEGVAPLSICVQAQHHERMDGSGYPYGLKGEEISPYGRMVAIVDVYDAITADRVYHKGMTPTQAIKKLLEWSGSHLDADLVKQFIRCIGIYPVGSLVLLESDRLGVVIEANELDQRLPTVRIMYHARHRAYVKQQTVDLAKPGVQDRIVKAVDPNDYKISVKEFL